ncbi:MAG TPA: hypothetical protein VHY58_20270 [Streptosporangiaceae bacterium]|nr:hypothetical protein [Streptosporangiaceae bacterium]
MPLTAVLAGGWTGALAGVNPLAVSGTRVDLNAVTAIPGGGAWAVGEKCSPQTGSCTPGDDEVLKESGSAWSQVPSPSPGGPADLVAVSADSASDAWAVGGYDGVDKSLYLHWTGGAWKQVPGPGGSDIALYGVAAISPTDALAVGDETSSTGTMTLGLHWNGKTWAKVRTPSPGGGGFDELYGVSAVSATDAWAVGIGDDQDHSGQTLVLHWNGSKWSQASAPPVPTFATQLNAVSAASGQDAWAVGQYYSPADVDQPLILHWNGSSWSRQKLPSLGHSVHVLHAVAATASDAWAVGLGPCVGQSINCPSKTLTMHLTSSGWKVVPGVSVSDRQDQNSLFGVAIAPGSKAWAVGDYFPAAQGEPFFATLQYWNGSSWVSR